jgi:ribosomal protein L37E
MTPETTVRAGPETKPCVRCRVEINAASGFCTLCGAGQRVRRRRTRWLIGVAAVAVAAGLAAGVLAVLPGGSGGGRAGQLRPYTSAALVTLVPAGWSGGTVVAPLDVSRVVFADPVDNRRRLSVTADRTPALSALRRARRVRALARSLGVYRQRAFKRIFLPGSRPAWLVAYDDDSSSRAVYLFSTCTPSVAMTVELRAPRRVDLPSSPERIAASAGPPCAAAPAARAPGPGPGPAPARRRARRGSAGAPR